jgi:hypothetical protein
MHLAAPDVTMGRARYVFPPPCSTLVPFWGSVFSARCALKKVPTTCATAPATSWPGWGWVGPRVKEGEWADKTRPAGAVRARPRSAGACIGVERVLVSTDGGLFLCKGSATKKVLDFLSAISDHDSRNRGQGPLHVKAGL